MNNRSAAIIAIGIAVAGLGIGYGLTTRDAKAAQQFDPVSSVTTTTTTTTPPKRIHIRKPDEVNNPIETYYLPVRWITTVRGALTNTKFWIHETPVNVGDLTPYGKVITATKSGILTRTDTTYNLILPYENKPNWEYTPPKETNGQQRAHFITRR